MVAMLPETTSLRTQRALARVARSISLGSYLSIGHGEDGVGGHDRGFNLASALEAVIGAILLERA